MWHYTFSPLDPAGPLGPYENTRITVKHLCISTLFKYCLLPAHTYIIEYQSMFKRDLQDLLGVHLVREVLHLPVNTNHCIFKIWLQ